MEEAGLCNKHGSSNCGLWLLLFEFWVHYWVLCWLVCRSGLTFTVYYYWVPTWWR